MRIERYIFDRFVKLSTATVAQWIGNQTLRNLKLETAWDQAPQGALFVDTEIREIIQKLGEYWGQIDRKCLGNGRDTWIEPTTYSAVGGQCYHSAMCSFSN